MALFQSNSKIKDFNKTYFEMYDVLYASFLKIIKDEATTKDVLQEAFVKVWNNWDEIRDKTDLKPLVYTYAKHVFFDHLRKEKNRREKEQAIQRIHIEPVTGEELIHAKQTVAKISAAVNRMPGSMKRVFILSKEAQLNNKEIADRLSISPFTVKRHLQDALRLLKKEMVQDSAE